MSVRLNMQSYTKDLAVENSILCAWQKVVTGWIKMYADSVNQTGTHYSFNILQTVKAMYAISAKPCGIYS